MWPGANLSLKLGWTLRKFFRPRPSSGLYKIPHEFRKHYLLGFCCSVNGLGYRLLCLQNRRLKRKKGKFCICMEQLCQKKDKYEFLVDFAPGVGSYGH
jgi:hypothetical protein